MLAMQAALKGVRGVTHVGKRAFGSGTSFEKFNYEDPFKLDQLLTEEERAISEAARAYS